MYIYFTSFYMDTADISRRWCKLNFGTLRIHVKSSHFPDIICIRRSFFNFLIQISSSKQLGQLFRIMICFYIIF